MDKTIQLFNVVQCKLITHKFLIVNGSKSIMCYWAKILIGRVDYLWYTLVVRPLQLPPPPLLVVRPVVEELFCRFPNALKRSNFLIHFTRVNGILIARSMNCIVRNKIS